MSFHLDSSETSIRQARHFYAEELRIVSDLQTSGLAEAFAIIPRERFLGPPPWKYSSGVSLGPCRYRTTSDPLDLYHDIFVALRSGDYLNNGQPSFVARLIDALKLYPGARVLHCGCGTGYFSAIMAEVVGERGHVVAVEIDPVLAHAATDNLLPFPQVKVIQRDASNLLPAPFEAILVNAGVTRAHPGWLESLEDGSVLILPLSVGRSLAVHDALLALTRRRSGFSAEMLAILTIFPSPTLREASEQAILNRAFETHALERLRSMRCDPHEVSDTCLAHMEGFCLSADAPDRDIAQGPRPKRR